MFLHFCAGITTAGPLTKEKAPHNRSCAPRSTSKARLAGRPVGRGPGRHMQMKYARARQDMTRARDSVGLSTTRDTTASVQRASAASKPPPPPLEPTIAWSPAPIDTRVRGFQVKPRPSNWVTPDTNILWLTSDTVVLATILRPTPDDT